MEENWDVERIVAIRETGVGYPEYRIRWKGFGEQEDTWEPVENLGEGCDRLIQIYWETIGAAQSTAKDEAVQEEEDEFENDSDDVDAAEGGRDRRSRLKDPFWHDIQFENAGRTIQAFEQVVTTKRQAATRASARLAGKAKDEATSSATETDDPPADVVTQTASTPRTRATAAGAAQRGSRGKRAAAADNDTVGAARDDGDEPQEQADGDDGKPAEDKQPEPPLTRSRKTRGRPRKNATPTRVQVQRAAAEALLDGVLPADAVEIKEERTTVEEQSQCDVMASQQQAEFKPTLAASSSGSTQDIPQAAPATNVSQQQPIPIDQLAESLATTARPTTSQHQNNTALLNEDNVLASENENAAAHAPLPPQQTTSQPSEQQARSILKKTAEPPTVNNVAATANSTQAQQQAVQTEAAHYGELPRPVLTDQSLAEYCKLRMKQARAGGLSEAPGPRAFLTALRANNTERLHEYGMYFRKRPKEKRAFLAARVGGLSPEGGAETTQQAINKLFLLLCGQKCTGTHFRENLINMLVGDEFVSSINIQDEDGRTPLHWAVKEGSLCKLQRIMLQRPKLNAVDASGASCLQVACDTGNTQALRLLLDAGADLNQPIADGAHTYSSIVHYAKSKKMDKLVHLLSEQNKKLQQSFESALKQVFIDVSVEFPLTRLRCFCLWQSPLIKLSFDLRQPLPPVQPNTLFTVACGLCRAVDKVIPNPKFQAQPTTTMWGVCPIESVHLNDVKLRPLVVDPDARFLFGCTPNLPAGRKQEENTRKAAPNVLVIKLKSNARLSAACLLVQVLQQRLVDSPVARAARDEALLNRHNYLQAQHNMHHA